MLRKWISSSVEEAVRAALFLRDETSLCFMEEVVQAIAACYRFDHKLLIAGNGGSLCDAIHFAEELTGQFRKKRRAFSAIALADPGHITCVGNDMGFEAIFSRGIEAHGRPNDLFIALSTSGNSQNLLWAMREAKERGLKTISFLGKTGGVLKGIADWEWIVPHFPYSDRIQEAHMAAIHIIIESVEKTLLGTPLEQTLLSHAVR